MKPRNKILVGMMALVPIFQSGCSANAAKDTPCERKCGGRPVSGGKLRAIPLSNEFSLECKPLYNSDGTQNMYSLKQFEFNFLLFDDRSTAAASSGTSGSTGSTPAAGSTLGDNSKNPDRVPMAGVAFYPGIIGLTAANGPDTSSDQWCTDSCGIATLKLTPVCVKQEMQVGIIVPGLTGEAGTILTNPNPSVKLTITNP